MPAACDKAGAGPCGTDTGNNQPSTDGQGTSGATTPGAGGSGPSTAPGQQQGPDAGGGGPGSGAPGSSAPGAAPGGGGPGTVVDPTTGQVLSADPGATAGEAIYANPTELSARRQGDDKPFRWLVLAELLALVLIPAWALSRRRVQR